MNEQEWKQRYSPLSHIEMPRDSKIRVKAALAQAAEPGAHVGRGRVRGLAWWGGAAALGAGLVLAAFLGHPTGHPHRFPMRSAGQGRRSRHPAPKGPPGAQQAISGPRAIAIAEAYLRKTGSHGIASSAVIVTRKTAAFDAHATARHLPPYLWQVTFHHVLAPAPGPGMVATLMVAVGTEDGKVYGMSWTHAIPSAPPAPTTLQIPSVATPVPHGTVTPVGRAQAIQDVLRWIPTMDPQAPTPTAIAAVLVTKSQAEIALKAAARDFPDYLWRVDVKGAIHIAGGTFVYWSIFVNAQNGHVAAYHWGNRFLP